MRTALLSLALMLPATASAASFGTTLGLGRTQIDINLNGNNVPQLTANGFLPSFDIHLDRVLITIHALETLDFLFQEEIFLGGNVYIEVLDSPVGGQMAAVIAPGGGIDILGDPFTIAATGEARFGVRTTGGGAGFGVFVVPAVGIGVNDTDSDLITGGTLQISAWFGGGGASRSRGPSGDANNTAPTL